MAVLPRARVSALVVGLVVVALIAVLAFRTHGSSTTVTTTSLGGKMAPPVAGRNLVDGRAISLATLRGRYVVVDFFASWCGTCLAEEPEIEAFYFTHRADHQVGFIGVDIDDSLANARNFIHRYGVTWPAVVDTGGSIAQSYGVADPPDLFLVDPAGTVISSISSQVTLNELNNWVHEAQVAKA